MCDLGPRLNRKRREFNSRAPQYPGCRTPSPTLPVEGRPPVLVARSRHIPRPHLPLDGGGKRSLAAWLPSVARRGCGSCSMGGAPPQNPHPCHPPSPLPGNTFASRFCPSAGAWRGDTSLHTVTVDPEPPDRCSPGSGLIADRRFPGAISALLGLPSRAPASRHHPFRPRPFGLMAPANRPRKWPGQRPLAARHSNKETSSC